MNGHSQDPKTPQDLCDKPCRILCFDSGIGGLAYLEGLRQPSPKPLHELHKAFGKFEWLYLADNAYFPFGEKNQDQLRQRICQVIKAALAQYPAKFVVLLCNTATVSAIDELRRLLPQQQFIGTVPAIKPAAAASQKRSIAMLASRSTSQAEYIAALHQKFAVDCQLSAINAASLIQFIEEDWPQLLQANTSPADVRAAIWAAIQPFVPLVLDSGADQLVLGCTHFLHLKTELQQQLPLGISDSLTGVRERLNQLLTQEISNGLASASASVSGTSPKSEPTPKAKLLLTQGQPLAHWPFWAAHYGLQQLPTLVLPPLETFAPL